MNGEFGLGAGIVLWISALHDWGRPLTEQFGGTRLEGSLGVLGG